MLKYFLLAFVAYITATALAQSQPMPTKCDDSLLGKIPPDEMIASCTALINAGTAKGDELASAYFERGTSYVVTRQFPLALKDFDEAIRLKPDFTAAIGQRGTTYGEMGQPSRAIQDFDLEIKLDPTHGGGYANRGTANAQLGQIQRAIEDFDEAIKLDPENEIDFANRGNAYANLGNSTAR